MPTTPGRARTLAQVYRRFGEIDAAETSPLYKRVAIALSESDEALRATETAPARKRHPALILVALHDLALAGRAPALASAYATADGDAAADAAINTLLQMTESVTAIAARRRTRSEETERCAVLYPAITEAAHRVGANAIGLIDVGCSAALNLSYTASTMRPPAVWWRGCHWKGLEAHRRYRPSATAAPPATASSAWQSSNSSLCAPRPLDAAGHAVVS